MKLYDPNDRVITRPDYRQAHCNEALVWLWRRCHAPFRISLLFLNFMSMKSDAELLEDFLNKEDHRELMSQMNDLDQESYKLKVASTLGFTCYKVSKLQPQLGATIDELASAMRKVSKLC